MRRNSIHPECLCSSGVLNGYLMPLIAVIVFGIFVTIAVINTFVSSKEYVADIMQQDLQRLATIFKQIDQDCGILSFDYQRNPINFLTVGTFASSEVGSMNLIHADKWQGPYLKDNLTVQNKEYVIRKTKKGLFLTPDDEVKLPNGKIIGKDIVLDENADIGLMMHNDEQLSFKGKPLALELPLSDKKELLKEAALNQLL